MSPFLPKARDPFNDCLPFGFPDQWNARQASVEQAYRRGFFQGAFQAANAMDDGVTFRQIEDWLYGPVYDWRYKAKMGFECPPDPPTPSKPRGVRRRDR